MDCFEKSKSCFERAMSARGPSSDSLLSDWGMVCQQLIRALLRSNQLKAKPQLLARAESVASSVLSSFAGSQQGTSSANSQMVESAQSALALIAQTKAMH